MYSVTLSRLQTKHLTLQLHQTLYLFMHNIIIGVSVHEDTKNCKINSGKVLLRFSVKLDGVAGFTTPEV